MEMMQNEDDGLQWVKWDHYRRFISHTHQQNHQQQFANSDIKPSSNCKTKRRKLTSTSGFARFVSIALIASALVGISIFSHADEGASIKVVRSANPMTINPNIYGRTLLTSNPPAWERCGYEKENKTRSGLFIALYLFLIFHIFVGVAILCDDFFVPSLESICEVLNLSEDVAGATFMAAGSSAPELFTSLAGIFVDSDVGVGTIVGSAVFNILVIIAMSGVFAGKVLKLDGRVIGRDAFFYSVSIILFAVFAYDGYFTLVESIVLFAMYIVYLTALGFNKWVLKLLTCRRSNKVEPHVDEEAAVHESKGVEGNSMDANSSLKATDNIATSMAAKDTTDQVDKNLRNESNSEQVHDQDAMETHLLPPTLQEIGKHRQSCPTNILSVNHRNHARSLESIPRRVSEYSHRFVHNKQGLLTTSISGRHSVIERHPDHLFTSHRGSTNSIFRTHASDSRLTPISTQTLVLGLESTETATENEVDASNSSNHSKVNQPKLQSEDGQIIKNEDVLRISDEKNGSDEDDEVVNCAPFSERICNPCRSSLFPSLDRNDDGSASLFQKLAFVWSWILYLIALPYMWLFVNTIPPGKKHYVSAFIACVLWIMGLSFALVTIVSKTGCIIGIDAYVMGLVIVAAGTSVPDALSSILVARDGYGDMAVSNAFGSNVFDIDLGLGLPFLIKILTSGSKINLLSDADRFLLDTHKIIMSDHAKFGFILLGILVFSVAAIALSGFKLSRTVSVCFVVMYFIFIGYAIFQELYCKRNGFVC
eukprot:m.54011 g.54011  ORF g.54011 m.54011 type:complete len:765 (-) comp7694_c0_seq2:76-2370(-)